MPRTNARINASIEHPELRPAETLPRGDSPRATVQASDDHVGLFIFLSNKRSPSLSSTTSFITLIDGWLASDEEDRGLQTMDDEEILEFISKEPAETEEEPQYGDDEEEERPVASSDSEAFRCAEVLMQWYEGQEESAPKRLLCLKSIRDLAASKRRSVYRQTLLTDFKSG
ncbi:hypothetical protein M514_25766 [Trichuris suis]|uniref:Uncharacterized protein n=1 Tax=Trichuris suis TaxID=68888 RepID=A0A085MXV1_9BILA|nr:hypothetical protein M514_25766 [Trichuris suis]